MRRFVRIVAGALALIVVVVAWGLAEPYFVDVQRHDAVVPGLPAGWEGERVALIADLQVGMWWDNTATIDRIVARLVREEPAVVLIAGDFIYRAGKDIDPEIEEVVGLLAPLTDAGIATYAVLGNHDYGMPTEKSPKDQASAMALATALERIGIAVLRNETATLPAPGVTGSELLHLVGIGPHVPREDEGAAALASVPEAAPRIVLMHHPDSFEELPAGSAPLALAGHTHGGQVRLPFTPQSTWMTFVEGEEVHADGWIHDFGQADNALYINRGIGFSVVPLRLNCPPEMTLFTLRAP